MDGLELSKIFGAGCAALLAFVGFGQLGSALVSVEQLDEPAYVVEIEDDTEVAEVEEAMPIGQLMAMADVEQGAKVFKKCSSCHKAEDGAAHGIGPNLHAVVGREIAAMDGYEYSDALMSKGGEWDFAALDGFLLKPKEWAPGTKMNYPGISKDEDRASVIAWLNEQSDAPLPLPAAEEEVAEAETDEPEMVEVVEGKGEVDMTESDPEVEVTTGDIAMAGVKTAREATEDMAVDDETARVQVPEEETGSTMPTEQAQDGMTREVVQDREPPATKSRALADELEAAAGENAAVAPVVEELREEMEEKTGDEEAKAEEAEAPAQEMAMAETGADAAPAEAAPAAPVAAASGFMALADLDRGKKVFNKCRACHKVAPGKNGVGPSLHGVVGRDIGAVDGFKYSDALMGKGGKWDVEALNGFLEKPKDWAPGTKMNYPGLRKEEDRASIIAWLNEQSDAPIDLGQ